jgi:cell division protein FtsN
MAQDFAKQSKKRIEVERRKPARAQARVIVKEQRNYWSWYFSGLLSGVIVAIIGYLGILRIETRNAEITQAQTQAGDTPAAEPPAFNFGFYENLKNAEINVSRPIKTPEVTSTASAASTATAPPTTTATTTTAAATEASQVRYLLQAGSFQNREEAENRRAEIMLQGMTVNIVPGVVSGRNLFRVQIGPLDGRQKAESAREVLSTLNIDSILLVVR